MSLPFFSTTNERARLRLLIGREESTDEVQSIESEVAQPHPACVKVLPFLAPLCFYAQCDTSQLRKIYIYLGIIGAIAAVSLSFRLWIMTLIVGFGGVVVLYLWLDQWGKARARDFEGDFATLLMSLASGLKTGLDPLTALCNSKALFAKRAVLTSELQKIEESIGRGESEEQALAHFASSIRYPDIALFRAAFLLSRREGSSLGASLERLARVIRQRQSFRRKVRAAVAMQRLSAFGIVICGVSITAVQFIAHPQAILETLNSSLGVKLVASGVSLILAGILWMWVLVRAEV